MGLCFYYRGTEIYESWNESLLTSTIDVNRYITHQLSPTSSLVAFCLSTFHLISIPLSKETIPSFKSPATRLYNPVCRLVRQSVSLSVFRFIGPLEPIRCDLKSSSFFYHRPARYPALFFFKQWHSRKHARPDKWPTSVACDWARARMLKTYTSIESPQTADFKTYRRRDRLKIPRFKTDRSKHQTFTANIRDTRWSIGK